MLWHAMPPELNTARLMAGAGPAPMLAAAAGWQTLSAALDAQAVELTARLNSLGEAWTGGGSDKALAAATPMVVWLQTASTQAKTRAMQATAQAAAYTQAMATTPSLPEIAANHITQAVLTATNFFGINTIPIALTEMDYFIRMWNQAALAMEVYQAETAVNTLFEKLEPMASILDPGASQSTTNPIFGMPSPGSSTPVGQLPPAATQTLGQLGEMSGPMQQLTQPLQQLTSLFSQVGGTESDNLAVKGIYWARRDAEPHRRRIVTTEVEHHAVLDSVNWLVEHEGAHVTWLPTAADGSVSATALREALQSHDDVALVSVMWANNEVGTILPIAEMSVVAMEFGVPMHSDAIQAVGQLPLDFGASGLSAMSVAGHKFGGPPGVGALLLRRDVTCVPLMHGGGQERDIRSGTPDVASAVGMATAAQIAVDGLEENSARLRLLRDRLVEGVLAEIDDVCLNGADDPMRLAGNAHFTFRGCEGDALLMLLDANGIECSTGSACTAGVAQPSHVLIAMGVDAASARGSLRLSLGHTSVEADVDAALEVLPGAVARARRAALAAAGASR